MQAYMRIMGGIKVILVVITMRIQLFINNSQIFILKKTLWCNTERY